MIKIKCLLILIVMANALNASEIIDKHFLLAKKLIHLIGAAEYDSALVYADKKQDLESVKQGLKSIRNVMPLESVLSITLNSSGYGFQSGDPKKTVNLLIGIDYGNKIAQLGYTATDSNGSVVVKTFNYQVMPASEKNSWTKAMLSRSWKAWLFNFLGFVNLALCLFALYRCVRLKGLRRKWLWIISIIFPVSQISISLPSQEIFFKILSFSLFGYGISWTSAFPPIIISFGFPLGSLIFLKKYSREIGHGVNIIIEKFDEK